MALATQARSGRWGRPKRRSALQPLPNPCPLPGLERYLEVCLGPAPPSVRSLEEGGRAHWGDLAAWVEHHVGQDELFHLHLALARDQRAVPPALEPSLVRASEVVCMALSEATLDRLERLC